MTEKDGRRGGRRKGGGDTRENKQLRGERKGGTGFEAAAVTREELEAAAMEGGDLS